MFTRKQYMNKEVSHQEYYGQWASESMINMVARCIGKKRILKSEDPHLNDIPLQEWDSMAGMVRGMCGLSISKSNATTCAEGTTRGGISLSDCVCVAKAAARQIQEANK